MENTAVATKGLVIRYFMNGYFLCDGKAPEGCENDGEIYIGNTIHFFKTWEEADAMRKTIEQAYNTSATDFLFKALKALMDDAHYNSTTQTWSIGPFNEHPNGRLVMARKALELTQCPNCNGQGCRQCNYTGMK